MNKVLRSRLFDYMGREVVITLVGKIGCTKSILKEVGVDYIELQCKGSKHPLIVNIDNLSTVILSEEED